jgi:hypothetical protein
MGRGFACCLGCISIALFSTWISTPHYRLLTVAERASLRGGDEYDDYALCDGVADCTACVSRTCFAAVHNCIEIESGNDGCLNEDGTDSYCQSFSLWSDCEYKGGVQVCGGPANRRHCADMVDYPNCVSWGDGKAGCTPGTLSAEDCQNCATIP